MPTKFKPSTYKRIGGVKMGTHYYMSGTSTKVLQEELSKTMVPAKMKDKIKTELVRRGVE